MPGRAEAADLSDIVRVGIHPAVGFARVGNSRDAFFYGPELPGQTPSGPIKDDHGAMAKQAARFRIFGFDRSGSVVAELTSGLADITWQVNVANSKAAWYSIDEPFDIPDSPAVPLRNASTLDRSSLVIHATPRRLRGHSAGPYPLDGGRFSGRRVTLGEVLTDRLGRLIVLPGSGEAVWLPTASPLGSFANNDGWTDTTCDGPVHAWVRIGNRVLAAEPAWVVCASPNYAPGLPTGLVTLYDSVESALVQAGRRSSPRTDFTRDVWPIFERTTDLQWVNEEYLRTHGYGSAQDWTKPRWQQALRDPSPANRPLRERILATFRDPAFRVPEPDLEPQIYGEAITMPPNLVEPRQWMAITPLQYRHLQRWARGSFTDAVGPIPQSLDQAPLNEQPHLLDRAALDACLGGPYHPGLEFPWIARVDWAWSDDMRLRQGSSAPDAGTWGPELTAEVALSRQGPIARLGPGGVTQWLGVPWQADSSSCRVGYQKALSLISPGFWPARIPNHVLTEDDYRIVMDPDRALQERRRAFGRRREWERFIARPTRPPTLALMVQEWFQQGVVVDRPGPRDGHFPARLKVEAHVGYDREPREQLGAWMWVPQLPMFPFVVTNSDDNTLRSVTERGSVSVLSLSAPLGRPEGITRDSLGNLYVCCMNANTVVKVDPSGVVTTIAEDLQSPVAIAIDPAGNLYVANYVAEGFITVIDPSGQVSTFVPASAGLVQPIGVAVTPDGALLVSCAGTNTVARIDLQTGAVINAAWISGLNGPRGMVFDRHFHLYLGQRWASTVTRYDIDATPLPLTLTGSAIGQPFGLAVDAQDRVYVSNSLRNLVNRITVDGDWGVVEDFATDFPNPGGIVFTG